MHYTAVQEWEGGGENEDVSPVLVPDFLFPETTPVDAPLEAFRLI